MVKCHEDAYWLHNLSLFALDIEGPWGQINKIMRKNRSPVFLSISLDYTKIKWSKCPKNCSNFDFFSLTSEILISLVLAPPDLQTLKQKNSQNACSDIEF